MLGIEKSSAEISLELYRVNEESYIPLSD